MKTVCQIDMTEVNSIIDSDEGKHNQDRAVKLAELEASLAAGIEPLVAIPLFCLDFMRIFPFLDGNRRIVVLLARHLLARNGHPVVSFVDLESEIHTTEKAFYQSLYQSSQAKLPPTKWLAFWWVVLMRVYQR